MTAKSKPRFQFSLRGLMLAIFVVALLIRCSLMMNDLSPERDPLPWVPEFLAPGYRPKYFILHLLYPIVGIAIIVGLAIFLGSLSANRLPTSSSPAQKPPKG